MADIWFSLQRYWTRIERNTRLADAVWFLAVFFFMALSCCLYWFPANRTFSPAVSICLSKQCSFLLFIPGGRKEADDCLNAFLHPLIQQNWSGMGSSCAVCFTLKRAPNDAISCGWNGLHSSNRSRWSQNRCQRVLWVSGCSNYLTFCTRPRLSMANCLCLNNESKRQPAVFRESLFIFVRHCPVCFMEYSPEHHTGFFKGHLWVSWFTMCQRTACQHATHVQLK